MKVHRGDDELVPEVYLHNPEPLQTDDDTSFAHNATRSFSARRHQLFSTDREIYLDTQYPLILLNDISPQLPSSLTPNFNPQPSPPQISSLSSPRRRRGKSIYFNNSGSPQTGSPHRTSIMSPTLFLNNSENKGSQIGDDMKFSQSGGDSPTKSTATLKSQVDLFEVAAPVKKVNKKKIFVKKAMHSIGVNIFVILLTIYVLLADDLRELVGTKKMDSACDAMAIFSFVVFVIETVLAFWIEKRYRWSLYFYLDVLSTVALIFDVEFLIQDNFPQIANEAAQVAEASRASRIATREGRVMKIIRLIQIGKRSQRVGAVKMIMGIEEREDTFEEADPADNADSGDNAESGENNENTENADGPYLTPEDIQLEHSPSIASNVQVNYSPSLPMSTALVRLEHSPSIPSNAQGNQSIGDEFALRVNEVKDSSVVLDEHPVKKKKKSRAKRMKKRLSKVFKKRKKKEFIPPPVNPPEDVDDEEEEDRKFRVLRVGRKLADRSIRRVIVMILSLLLLIPLFQAEFYFHPPATQPYNMQLLKVLDDPKVSEDARKAALQTFVEESTHHSPELVYLKIGDEVSIEDSHVDLTHLKKSEYTKITIKTSTWGEVTSVVSSRHHNLLHAWLRIINIAFICVILTYGAVLFSKDANKLVLQPLQRIIKRVNKIAMDPVKAKEQVTVVPKKKKKKSDFDNETVHIENAIIKIGKLLAVGFGDAGASITAQNIAYYGEFCPTFPGKKEAAIFGYCDIRDFTIVTEVLQEEVMVFVNSVAHIVHSLVDRYGGSPNKNSGDGFLIVWKFSEDVIIEHEDGQLGILPTQESQNLADAALISFLKIMGKINRDWSLLQYRENEILQSRIPDYKVRLGFGLHFGWAIEGALGSEYKIDASYLSANVNLAAQLENATKQYKVPLLFSGEFCELLSDNMKQNTKQIDLVSVEGVEKPVELYTVDAILEGMKAAAQSNDVSTEESRRQNRDKKKKLKNVFKKGNMAGQLEADRELRFMLSAQNEEFNEVFEMGFDAYIEGDWITAKKKLEVCLEKRENDGPSLSLYNYIENLDFLAPDDWQGYRPLLSKK